MGFDWDDANIDHLARHNITPDEAEEAVLDRKRVATATYGGGRPPERRTQIIGKTDTDRIITVITTIRNGQTRVITGWNAEKDEQKAYRRKK